MPRLTESDLEQHVLNLLEEAGHNGAHGEEFEPESDGERESYHGTFLVRRLKAAVQRLNPKAPPDAVDSAVNALRDGVLHELIQENRRLHRLMVDGVPVSYECDGETIHDRLRLVDWSNAENDWLAVNQFTVVGSSNRRPDIVIFLNGLPLVVIELKAPESANADIRSAYNQLQTYKRDIPALFHSNLLCVASDGFSARFGTISADFDRFMTWRTVDGENLVSPKSELAVETLLKGLLRPDVLCEMLRAFTVFENDGLNVIKKAAGYHQFHAAQKGLRKIKEAVKTNGKAGVVWHTQGSGKSLLMAFLAGVIVKDPELGNPTILVLTDRNDLDNQLFETFSRCMELFGQKPEQVESVADLRKHLDCQVGGVVFSTIQKFRPEDGDFPLITDRRNLIVFVDEAHRSQYGFGAKIDTDTGKKSYGFAYYVRKGLPNATFVGFTGTPIELVDKNTTEVFGADEDVQGYMSRYSFQDSIRDKATLPLHFEAPNIKLKIDKAAIDEAYKQITDDMSEQDRDDLAKRAAKMAMLVKNPERVRAVVEHIVQHYQTKVEPNGFKAQVVCFDRECCVLYKAVMDELIGPEASAIVMSGAQKDPPVWNVHLRDKDAEENLLDRFRDPADPLKFVIVTSKLLTGFEAPILQAMYLDKPMKDQNLLQAICRVNRTYGQMKTHGLIIDYIGIFDDVARALDFDEKAVQQVVSNIDDLRKALPAQMQKCLAFFPNVDRSVGGFEGLMAAQQCLPNNATRDKFAAE